MRIATIIVRLVLGAGFIFAGGSTFFMNRPPEPGLAGVFDDVFYKSHWALFVSAAQLTAGVLMLIDRFVPVALIVVAAFLYNSFAFHLTMAQSSLWAPIFVFALWLLVAIKCRTLFAPIFAASPAMQDRSHHGPGIFVVRADEPAAASSEKYSCRRPS